MGLLLAIAVVIVGPALLALVIATVMRRRRREIAAMRDVPKVLHGASEEAMLEYLETSDEAQDERGALSAPEVDAQLSLAENGANNILATLPKKSR